MLLLLAVPCSLKKELKNSFLVENNQQQKSENTRISCSTFIQNEKSDHQEGLKILQSPGFYNAIEALSIVNNMQLEGFYLQQKEKIPSFLLYEQFLI